jgi:hypothetical protein
LAIPVADRDNLPFSQGVLGYTHRVRRWTRLGTVAIAAHVFYELACGVAMPSASIVGPAPAAAGWATGSVWLYRSASRQPRSRDGLFAVVNGVYLSAVIAHFAYWPKHLRAGVPLLTECEGLRGRVIAPYNMILYASGVAAVAGVCENRDLAKGATPIALVPILIALQRWEFTRLRRQARAHPTWWNRRLQAAAT